MIGTTPRRILFSAICISGAVLFISAAGPGLGTQKGEQAQPEGGAEESIEALPRGPIHEAFAVPVSADPRPGPIIDKKPPAPIEELPPELKPEGNNVMWIGGYFAWDEDAADFIWISGFWRDVPPDRQWVPGHWMQADDGWQWIAGYWSDASRAELEYLPPPPASLEEGPTTPAPAQESVYVPGCWVYQETRYLWRPGFWMRPYSDWDYVPAHYVWTPAGYLFVDGYWDYPFARRGLLFAPAHIPPTWWGRHDWTYTPRYAVSVALLLDALFVRADFGRYHYGNYFAPVYARHGFVPWFDYRMARNSPDPLVHYWRHRQGDQWERELRARYEAGRAGRLPKPAQEQAIIASLAKLDQKALKLQTVPSAKLQQERKTAEKFRALAKERQEMEARIVKEDAVPRKPADPPQRAKVNLPKGSAPQPKGEKAKAPPLPSPPKQVEKPHPKSDPVKAIRVSPKAIPVDKGKPGGEPPPKPDVKPAPKPDVKPAPKPDVKPSPKPDVKPAPKPDVKPDPKPVKPAPKPDVKPAPKPDAKPAPQPKEKGKDKRPKDDLQSQSRAAAVALAATTAQRALLHQRSNLANLEANRWFP